MIPKDWECDGLGRFWSVTDCKHVTAQFVQQGFPLASIREVQSRFVDLTTAKQTTAKFYSQLIEGGRKPCAGDLILSRNATVGEIAQVADWHPLFAMGQDVCMLRKKSPTHSTEYLQAVFQSPIIMNQLSNLMVGSTFKRANVEQIRNFTVPMPSPPEQRAIAEVLSDVDALLGTLDRLIAKKRDLKQAAMQQLLSGQTRFPGFCGEWQMRGLLELAKIAKGQVDPRREPNRSKYLVGPVHVESGTGKLLNLQTAAEQGAISGKYLFEPGDIVYGKINPYLKKAFLAEFEGLCSADMYPLRAELGVSPGYLLAVILGREFTKYAESVSVRSGMPKINRDEMKGFLVSLPKSLEEQTAIAEALSDMDSELTALEQRRDKTRALKQGMMQELLTGKTRLV